MIMQAVIKVHPGSAYRKWNGKVQNVAQLLPGMVAIEMQDKNVWADFTFKEVTILNFDHHIQAAFDAYNWYGNAETRRNLASLEAYAKFKGIAYKLVQNCPA